MAMKILRVLLCAVVMVSAVLSKPVNLSEGGGSSESSESDESNESEDTPARVEPSQDPLQTAVTEADVPTVGEEAAPADTAGLRPSADAGASPATRDSPALPSEDPHTSTDASRLVPGDPSPAAHGTDIPPEPTQDSVHDTAVSPQPEITATGIFMGIGGTSEPQVITATATYQGFPQGATSPSPPHIEPTLPPLSSSSSSSSSSTPSLPIPVSVAMTSGPVCFTFQFREPDPPRGDSI